MPRTAPKLTALSLICLVALSASSFAQVRPASADCNRAGPEPIAFESLAGNPFMAIPTRNGCWVFVSLDATDHGSQSGIAVLHRVGGNVSLVQLVPIKGEPAGMILTHDGKLLIAANRDGAAFLDAERLISGRADAVLGYLSSTFIIPPDTARRLASNRAQAQNAGSILVNLTGDDRFLFVSNEWTETITVINLEKARTSRFTPTSIIGSIPVGVRPIAVTFSPDEKYLYATIGEGSQSDGWPIECKPEIQATASARAVSSQGAILVLEVAKATSDPLNAVIAKVPAGCSPGRIALSPKGDVAYVTVRADNRLLAFDTAKLIRGSADAIVGKVPVGVAPVGVAVIDSGHKIVVTNSDRWFGTAGDNQSLTVIDAAKLSSGSAAVLGAIQAGAFPRELSLTADQRTLFVTNFKSKTLEIVDLARLPLSYEKRREKNSAPEH
jgi:DNA-binding beta-propeller fold protein YncE